jgi:2-polyprenyl-3-methyl-5-hydroxy-6-metoxy-1,4-benzoquinol methylase
MRCSSPLPDVAADRKCASCDARYPLLDGRIEVLTPDYEPQSVESWDPQLFEVLDDMLDGHVWYVGRNRAILAFLRAHAPEAFTGNALDLGCGGGFVTSWLASNGLDIRGADIFEEGLRLARKRTNARLVLLEPGQVPYRDEFDLVVLSDVIEHVDDDVALLEAARRALHPRGAVLITVPAFSWLWGKIDDAAHHRRRYSAGQLRRTLDQAGFVVQAVSYYMMPLVPVIYARKFINRGDLNETFARSSTPPGPVASAVLGAYLRVEEHLVGSGLVPIGSSLLALGRAPATSGP